MTKRFSIDQAALERAEAEKKNDAATLKELNEGLTRAEADLSTISLQMGIIAGRLQYAPNKSAFVKLGDDVRKCANHLNALIPAGDRGKP